MLMQPAPIGPNSMPMFRAFLSLPAILLVLLAAQAPMPAQAAIPSASPIHSVVTFGDSWSDAGTFGHLYGSAPGSSWSQLLARRYGDDQTPYLYVPEGKPPSVLGGLNYAQGGARTVSPAINGAAADSIPYSAAIQIRDHLKAHGDFTPDQLVILWIGFNDIAAPFTDGSAIDRRAFASGRGVTAAQLAAARANARKAAQECVALVRQLLTHKVVHVAVINEPDIGATPFEPDIGPGGLRIASELTRVYDGFLAAALPKDRRVLLIDAYTIFKHTSGQGFKNIHADACANHDFLCGPPGYVEPHADETYLYAGYGHLTRHGRRLIASQVAAAVNQRWP
jgi:phospholipase/lecithinase/hemolysin